MHGVWPVADVRVAESALMARLPDGALMQRAAHALSVHCGQLLGRVYGSSVVLIVGSGSNGGDALHAGARLARRGARVHAVLLDPSRAHSGGLAALRGAGGLAASTLDGRALIESADLVVDGILGIGGRGGLRGAAAELAEVAARRMTVAVDLPSGVDADTGAVGDSAIRADSTVTFGALKPGILCDPGASRAGEIRLVDIGLRADLPEPRTFVLEASDVAALVGRPGASDDKYTRGVVGIVAGSPSYPGAGVLTTGAALHGDVGMVRYLGLAPDPIRARYPEVVVHEGAKPHEVRVQAWVIGSGLGTDDTAITLLAGEPELVRERRAPTVLTPHDREFARIAGEPGDDRLTAARRAADDLGATVLLKGNATIVAEPGGRAYLNTTGSPWLATAGSGDVLSGVIGSFLACGVDAALAAAAGAHLHGVAGQLAGADGPATAADVLAALRAAYQAVQ